MKEGVSRQQNYGNPPYVGIGIVILPFKQDREKYIKQCYRSRRVNLLLETGTVAVNCNVIESAIQDIKFPEDFKKLGSQVIYLTERINQTPYVIGVLDKIYDRVNCEENGFNFSRDIGKSRVNVIGKANGELHLNVESTEGSLIKINSIGEESEIELNCEGSVKVNGGGSVEINSTSEIHSNFINERGEKDVRFTISENGLKYEDNSGNVFEVDKEKGIINNFKGSEPLTKGNTLKTQLDQNNAYLTQLQTAISAALTTLESLGLGSLSTFTSSMSGAQKGNYSNINSKKTFTD